MDQIVVDPLLLGALAMLLALIGAAVGFVLGQRRPRAEDLARIAGLEAELAAAQSNAESTRGGIDEHFEASAALFGKLARDYRALFEHWADSASKLGVSEARANAIIDEARSRLLEDARTIDTATDPDAKEVRDPSAQTGDDAVGETAPDGSDDDGEAEVAATQDAADEEEAPRSEEAR